MIRRGVISGRRRGGTAAVGGDPTGVQAKAADSVCERTGIVTHVDGSYYDAIWASHVLPAIQELAGVGLRHVRSGLNDPADNTFYTRHEQIRDAGLKWQIAMRKWQPATIDSWLPQVVTRLGSTAFSGFEGTNEQGGTTFVDADADTAFINQQGLWNTVRNTIGLTASTHYVAGPSMLARDNVQRDLLLYDGGDPALPRDWASYLDMGTQHLYPDGNPPLQGAYNNEAFRHPYVAGFPWITSETGYHNANITGGLGHTEEAIYRVRMHFDWYDYQWGTDDMKRFYHYEILNKGSLLTSRGDNWGLMSSADANGFTAGEKFPAYWSVHNTLALFNDPTAVTPGLLDYSVTPTTTPTGDTGPIRHLLYQKSDGTFLLVIYRQVKVWDKSTSTAITVSPINVTVTLNQSSRAMSDYIPRLSTAAQSTAVAATSHTISVDGDVHVLALT